MFSDDVKIRRLIEIPKRTAFSNEVQCVEPVTISTDTSKIYKEISQNLSPLISKNNLNPYAEIFIPKRQENDNTVLEATNICRSRTFPVFALYLFCFAFSKLILLTSFILLQLLKSTYDDPKNPISNPEDDPYEILTKLKDEHSDRPVIAHLNINSLSPKFEQLSSLIRDKIDILLVSETKIDASFPNSNFFIDGY